MQTRTRPEGKLGSRLLGRYLGWESVYSHCCYRKQRATEGKSGTHIRFSDTKGRACDTDHN